MTAESRFQSYFLKLVPHGYRTALITGSGFPDCLVVQGDTTNFVEVKILDIGPSGDRAIRTVFKKSQPPWYAEYLHKGGDQLFVLFKLPKGYGLLHVNKAFIDDLPTLKYSQLKEGSLSGKYRYSQIYKTLKELIDDQFS